MREIPKDVAERLYEVYAITLTNPVPFDELMPCKNDIVTISDRIRAAYEKGIVIPGEQLFWVQHAHKKNADLNEPYDVGVKNALALAMYIFSDKEPGFEEKPEGLRVVIDIFERKVKGLQERILDDQKNYTDKLAEQNKIRVAEVGRLNKLIIDERANFIAAKEAHAVEIANLKAKLDVVKEDDNP